MKGKFPVERFQTLRTPFYYYDTELLRQTLQAINATLRPADTQTGTYTMP